MGHRLGAISHVATDEKAVGLTFDDGPDPEYTPRLLDVLAKHGAKATFFMVGKAAQKYPEVVQSVARAGHAIGNHSWDHPAFPFVNDKVRRQQIRACARAIAPYGSRLFRPPYGKQTVASHIEALLLGYKVIAWNAIGNDWLDDTADMIVERIMSRLRPGSIVLLHDALFTFGDERYLDRTHTIEAVDVLLTRLKSTFRFVTVPELLRIGRPQRKNWYEKADPQWLAGLSSRTL